MKMLSQLKVRLFLGKRRIEFLRGWSSVSKGQEKTFLGFIFSEEQVVGLGTWFVRDASRWGVLGTLETSWR